MSYSTETIALFEKFNKGTVSTEEAEQIFKIVDTVRWACHTLLVSVCFLHQDEDGMIDHGELKVAGIKAWANDEASAEGFATQMIQMFDADGDKRISCEEWKAGMIKARGLLVVQLVTRARIAKTVCACVMCHDMILSVCCVRQLSRMSTYLSTDDVHVTLATVSLPAYLRV